MWKIIISKFILLLAVLLFSVSLKSENITKTGTTSAKFLSVGIGSRANGMGDAFVAIANDATAMYWNPAGLSWIKNREFLVNYSQWFLDINFSYTGFAMPLGNYGTFGISLTYIKSIDEMEVTTEDYPEGTGETFSAGHYAIGFSYGKNLTDRFAIGGNIKYIGEYIMNCRANSFAIDIGTLFITPFKDVRFGVCVSNFGKKMQITGPDLLVQKDIDETKYGNNESVNAYLSTDRFDLPLLLRVGLSGEFVNKRAMRITWAVDALHPNDNTEYINCGIEVSLLNDLIFLRSGKSSIFMKNRENKYSAGFGLNIKINSTTRIAFDYSYQDYEHLPQTYRYSLIIKF